MNRAHKSIGVAFADNKAVYDAIEEAKKPKQQMHRRENSRHLVTVLRGS